MSAMFDTLLYDKQDGIAWVTLNRPDVLNAINMRMRDELWDVVQAVRDDPEVQVVIFRGAGDRAFSAGVGGMVGGGPRARPGGVSLAHLGVLFLDELPECQRPALEALRQPMESGRVTVARANAHVN